MAGHSKWANIKHKKAASDAKRGKAFTKLIKEITVAARMGGGDPDGNPRLRLAVDKARAQSMPKDNIERAIKKGTGELDGGAIEEITYEGYGPGGIAVLVDCATDNKKRTVSEVRAAFSKRGGNLGENGSVAWMFEKKGVIRLPAEGLAEEALFDQVIEAGGEDMREEDGFFIVTTGFEELHHVNEALQKSGLKVDSADLEMIPKNTVKIGDEESATKVMNLIEVLEDCDDVQSVWANFDIDDEVIEKIA